MSKVDTASPCIVRVHIMCSWFAQWIQTFHPNPVKFFHISCKAILQENLHNTLQKNLQILGIVPMSYISIILILVHPRVNSDDENVKKDFADFSKESI